MHEKGFRKSSLCEPKTPQIDISIHEVLNRKFRFEEKPQYDSQRLKDLHHDTRIQTIRITLQMYLNQNLLDIC